MNQNFVIQIASVFYIVDSIIPSDFIYFTGTQEACVNYLDMRESGYLN